MTHDAKIESREVKLADLPRKRGEGYVSVYANNVGSAMGRYDLRLIFGQVVFGPSEDGAIEDSVSVTMAWEHVVPFRDLLDRLIEKYETDHGKIRDFKKSDEAESRDD